MRAIGYLFSEEEAVYNYAQAPISLLENTPSKVFTISQSKCWDSLISARHLDRADVSLLPVGTCCPYCLRGNSVGAERPHHLGDASVGEDVASMDQSIKHLSRLLNQVALVGVVFQLFI